MQRSNAIGQRVWKRQPEGGLTGDGMSPVRMMRLRRDSTLGSGIGNRRQQRLGVGMQRVLVEVVAVGDLDDLADVHHRHAGRDVADHREVVGDEEKGQTELILEVLQQVDHLCLNRDVERRDRLVGDDELRIETASARAIPMRWRWPPENSWG